MFDHDEHYPYDNTNVGRGIVYGVLLGGLMWAGIIGGIVWLMH